MRDWYARVSGFKIEPIHFQRFHFWMTVTWFLLIFPSVILWKNSIVWVVVMSAWANLAGHFGSWQASRVEVKQDEAA